VLAAVLAGAAALLPGGAATSSTAGVSGAPVGHVSAPKPLAGLITYSSGFILSFPDLGSPSQVFTIRPDGSHNRQLTHVPDGRQAGAPDLSRDGRTIVYVSNEDADNFAVWAMNADGTHQHRVFGRNGFDFFQPHWSPDGRRLVVTRCDNSFGFTAGCDLVLTRSDGSHQRTLVGGGRFSGNAAWSPNGRKIAFDSDIGGFVSTVRVISVAGGRSTRLTKPTLEAFWPTWSPDGSRLVISSNCCRPLSQVFTMRPDGSGLRQLTHATGGGGPAFAAYSPDGRHIVYGSDELRGLDFEHLDLFVMNSDGSHQHRILEAAQSAVGPDWERAGR
jgi:Tol biopolymer transport system component